MTSDKPGLWQAHGERTIYDSPWVWLGQVDVEPPGGDRYWHHVMRLRRAAVAALLDDQDRVLMLWRHRFVADRWGWELPGGLVDDGEDPASAANRELAEETGYRAGYLEHLVTFQPMPGSVDAEHYVYTGRDPQWAGDPTDPAEAARVEWVPLASVPALIAAGEIWSAGSVAALPLLLMHRALAHAGAVQRASLRPDYLRALRENLGSRPVRPQFAGKAVARASAMSRARCR